MGQAGGHLGLGTTASLACLTDLFTAQIYDLPLKFYRRYELASSLVAFLWSLFEFETFVPNTFLPKGQHHILLQRGP